MTTLDWPADTTAVRHICAHCHQPIPGAWVLEVDGHTFHAALHYRGGDQRRCRDVARALALA
jgi:hypothetical protein